MTKKTSRILILTSTYPRWSRDTTPGFVADFASHLAPHFQQVYILAPHYIGAKRHEDTANLHLTRYRYFFPALSEDIAYNGGAVSKIKKTPLYAIKLLSFMVALFFNTLFLAVFRRISVINAHWLVPQGFVGVLVKFLTGKKLVITIHGSDVLTLNGKYMRIIKRFTLRHADVVCVNSSVTKAACLSLYDRDYELIPMGIDITHYQAIKPSEKLQKQYNLGDFTILFVGRLTSEKGINYLLEALKELKKTKRVFTALIVGSGPLESELKSSITEYNLQDEVTMIGWVDSSELPSYYATADIFVGPSLHEAQGLVFLEALATGLPVITTDQGGMKDFMKNGKNGFMVPSKSAAALTRTLSTLYDDRALLQKLKKHASASVTASYSWENVTHAYLKLLRDDRT